MRLVNLTKIKDLNKVLARPVYGAEGQRILNAGVELKQRFVKNLQKMGINSVYIKDEQLYDIEEPEIVAEKTKHDAKLAVKKMVNVVKSGTLSNSLLMVEKKVADTMSMVLNDILDNKVAVVSLVDIRTIDGYFVDHSFNVAVLSIITALKMGYPLSKIRRDAVGFLLHDIGNTKVPENILKKPGKLTASEYEQVKKHSQLGYEIFRKTSFFSDGAAYIINQHHERFNGKGYPRRLHGKQINVFANIAAVTDVFDALVSDRPYRKALPRHLALKEIMTKSGIDFSPEVVDAFISFVAAYPIGTHVMLNNDESGLVIGNTYGNPFNPKVRILYREKVLLPHPAPYEIDLSEEDDLQVVQVLEEIN